MGCYSSSELEKVYPEEWLTNFDALQFRREDLVKMERIFDRIDESADGTISLHELLDYVGLKENDFAKRTFGIFDEDGNGTIDFREFVLSMWNFCSVVDSSLRLFAFDLYDTDASGRIDKNEVESMLREVYGDGYDRSPHASRLLQKVVALCSYETKEIDSETFALFAKDNPALLFPAFELQRKLQRKIMGVDFWESHVTKRLELSKGTQSFVSVKEILDSQLSKTAFRNLVEAPLNHHAQEAKDRGRAFEVNHHAKAAIDSAGTRFHRNTQTVIITTKAADQFSRSRTLSRTNSTNR
mmetsp:Transcript_46202/g.93246  ORF Transcript_46202/g.93246 Transcript_46202/m.93246 type:complete len:298 (+) Transcript_46202:115-1008(+)